MELTSFDQANTVFDKPDNMTYEQCQAASAFQGHDSAGQPVIITCWKLTAAELEEIKRTGRVWCTHIGTGIQPHVLHTADPFL